jgi:hypothetical protein
MPDRAVRDGRVREVRELLAFAEMLVVNCVEHHVAGATYAVDADGALACRVVIRPGMGPADEDRIRQPR